MAYIVYDNNITDNSVSRIRVYATGEELYQTEFKLSITRTGLYDGDCDLIIFLTDYTYALAETMSKSLETLISINKHEAALDNLDEMIRRGESSKSYVKKIYLMAWQDRQGLPSVFIPIQGKQDIDKSISKNWALFAIADSDLVYYFTSSKDIKEAVKNFNAEPDQSSIFKIIL